MLNHHRPHDYRAPRTLTEAFGPYARAAFPRRESATGLVLAWAVAIVIGAALGVMLAL